MGIMAPCASTILWWDTGLRDKRGWSAFMGFMLLGFMIAGNKGIHTSVCTGFYE